jgi:hypothetical protein
MHDAYIIHVSYICHKYIDIDVHVCERRRAWQDLAKWNAEASVCYVCGGAELYEERKVFTPYTLLTLGGLPPPRFRFHECRVFVGRVEGSGGEVQGGGWRVEGSVFRV